MNLFQPSRQSGFASIGLFAVRLIVGLAFVYHGWGKIQHPFNWMGPEASIPGWLQGLAAFSEFGGGLAWVAGFLVPLASFGIFCTMAVATNMHMMVRHDPFVNPQGGPSYEPALVYLGIAFLLFAIGPGKVSLDAIVFGERSK